MHGAVLVLVDHVRVRDLVEIHLLPVAQVSLLAVHLASDSGVHVGSGRRVVGSAGYGVHLRACLGELVGVGGIGDLAFQRRGGIAVDVFAACEVGALVERVGRVLLADLTGFRGVLGAVDEPVDLVLRHRRAPLPQRGLRRFGPGVERLLLGLACIVGVVTRALLAARGDDDPAGLRGRQDACAGARDSAQAAATAVRNAPDRDRAAAVLLGLLLRLVGLRSPCNSVPSDSHTIHACTAISGRLVHTPPCHSRRAR